MDSCNTEQITIDRILFNKLLKSSSQESFLEEENRALRRGNLLSCYIGGIVSVAALLYDTSVAWWAFYLYCVFGGLFMSLFIGFISGSVREFFFREEYSKRFTIILTILVILLSPILLYLLSQASST